MYLISIFFILIFQEQEELKRQSQLLHQQQQQQFISYQSPYRSSYPPKLGSPTQPGEGGMSPHHVMAPPLPKSPPPALYRGPPTSTPPQKSPVTPPQSSPSRSKPDKKSVSFNETVDTNEPASPSPVETERVHEDPNVSLIFVNTLTVRLI